MEMTNLAVNAEKALEAAEKAEKAVASVNADVAQSAADQASAFLGIDFSNPNWDLFVLMFFLVAALLYGMSLGRDRIIVILVSIYMALAVVEFMPPLEIAVNNSYAMQIASFVGLFVGLFFLLSRSALLNTFGRNAVDGSLMQVLLFSFLHVGLLISITLSYLPPEVASNFSETILNAFTGEWQQFAWICGPIVAMIMVKGPSRGGGGGGEL